MAKQKFYVVWVGRETGIFDNWDDCKKLVDGFQGAKYKSFTTKALAEDAFASDSSDFIGKNVAYKSDLSEVELTLIGSPIPQSISVDGAWNTATGDIEYQGVFTETKELIFKVGPFQDGTNNIAEFLAIVHALVHCQKENLDIPIYSDSENAIKWIVGKKARTKLAPTNRNDKLFKLIERAEKLLAENEYSNKVLKWETRAWGENPADFGRK